MENKIISIEELKKRKELKVYFQDEIREKYSAVEVNGVVIRNIYRIIAKKGRLLIFQNIDGKEIARLVIDYDQHLEIDALNTYNIVS